MTAQNNIRDLFNTTAFDNNGDKLGEVQEVFVDDHSGKPTFVEVKHGLFGMSSSLVPLKGHRLQGDDLQLAFDKDRIKDAPNVDADQGLTPEEQNRIFEHYGVGSAQDQTDYVANNSRDDRAGVVGGAATHRDENRTDVADRDRVAGDNSIIRSEEQLDVHKEQVQSGKARLRKYVVEDTETVEVPVTREEVRVERTPISEADAANFRGEIGEDEASVVLNEERVDVTKKTVPVEKVNLAKEQVTETERVTETLAKERIETDADIDRDRR